MSYFLAAVASGVDCSTFVRAVAIFPTALVADVRSFCWFFLLVVNAVNLVFLCSAWYQERVLSRIFSLLANLTVLARSRISCCSNFCRRVLEAHFSTIWSRIISSSNVPKSQNFASSLRLVRYVSPVCCVVINYWDIELLLSCHISNLIFIPYNNSIYLAQFYFHTGIVFLHHAVVSQCFTISVE